MSGAPEELIFLLIFGFVWLVQFLRRQRRRRARQAGEPKADDTASATADEAQPESRPHPVVRPPGFTPNLAEGPRPAKARRDHAAPAPARHAARRYSRSALMGDRRAVQDAIVVATILQPCRAKKPYGSD